MDAWRKNCWEYRGRSIRPAGLTSRCEALQSKDASAPASDRSRECLLAGEGGRHVFLWRRCSLDQTLWGHRRQLQHMVHSRGFWHTESLCKPDWGDAELSAMEMQTGRDRDPGRSAGYKRAVSAKCVSQLCKQEKLTEAVEGLGVLVQTGSSIAASVFYTFMKRCVVQRDLVLSRRVHALIVEQGYELDTFLCNHMIRMYASHGRLHEAMAVFTVVAKPDAFMWSSLISAHVNHGLAEQAIELYEMGRSSLKPDGHVFVAALQACARESDLKAGQQVHADVLASGVDGFEPDLFVWNSLIDMYAKCGSLEDARRVFDALGQKDVVSWNAMIAGYSQQGMWQEAFRLYSVMQEEGRASPDSVTFLCLLQGCASMGAPALEKGKQFHAHIEARGLQIDVVVGCSLVKMYVKCGSLVDAQGVFDGLPHKKVTTWNAMIAGYSHQGMLQEALHVYRAMQEIGTVAPDSVTFVCLLQACASVGTLALEKGRQMQQEIRERGLQADVFVANSLVNMYAKCGSLEDAQRAFDDLDKKDVVTWTALIAGYAQRGMGQEALHLYTAMQDEGIAVPDPVTFVSLLQACTSVGIQGLQKGRQVHAQIEELGLTVDAVIGCSLVDMYAKCGSLEDAEHVFYRLDEKNVFTWTTLLAGYAKSGRFEDTQRMFDRLSEKDVVMWNAMIAGHSQQGMGQEALRLYKAMEDAGRVAPDSVTFVSVLQACASVGISALEKGKQLHAQIRERGLQADMFVANSLVDMYAKCGSLGDAQKMFDRLTQKDVVTWNAMITGYSQQGLDLEALSLYRAMHEEGTVAPDSVTFVCLLQACANVAALHLGRRIHAQIEEQGLDGDVLVAVSLINMYGKSGSMVDAQKVFDMLAERDIVAWNALISGYTDQGAGDVVSDLFHKMREHGVEPTGITFLSVLKVCSHAGLMHKGLEYFDAMSTDYGISPTAEHYTCMVDLMGRAGHLEEALALIRRMPALPDAAVWHTLLGACRKWCNVEVGCHAFDEAVNLDKKDPAAYVLMANLYTSAQMWEQAQEMQARRRRVRAWKKPGQSWWTDMDGVVHGFLVMDKRHFDSKGDCARFKQVLSKMNGGQCEPS